MSVENSYTMNGLKIILTWFFSLSQETKGVIWHTACMKGGCDGEIRMPI